MIKIEKESLVETINRLNKEIDLLKLEGKSKPKSKIVSASNSVNLSNAQVINTNNNKFNNSTLNDLPELFKLELDEKEKAIQILQCSLEERDKIIEQFKNEQNKIIIRNKSSHHELINTIEDLKFKIINLEKEINEKNNFINVNNNEFNMKKLETDNLKIENKQLKDQINLIPALKVEIENLKIQLKKQISQTDDSKEIINSKDGRIIKLEKTVSVLKKEVEEKENQLNIANEECNTTKLYEKKRDIIHSTLLDIRDLKEKISKDKNNLTIALNTNPQNNIFCDNSHDLPIDNNETMQNPAFGNLNNLLKYGENDLIVSNQAPFNNSYNYNNQEKNKKSQFVIEEATPRTEGLESYRKVTEEDINFFQSTVKNFDLNLLTEYDFLLNSKNWGIINPWFTFFNKKTNSNRSSTLSNSSTINLKLNLLYKATRDGFSHFDFKEKCAGKNNTLVISITNHNKIIGGYTPIAWENTDDHIYLKDESERSFIFSVSRRQKLKLISPEHAICISPDSGPIFGGGSDFEIVDNCNVNYNKFYRIGHSYEYTDNPDTFFGSTRYFIKDYFEII